MPNQRFLPFLAIILALGIVAGAVGARWWSQRDSTPVDVLPEAAAPLVRMDSGSQAAISASRHNAITRAAAEVGPAVVAVSIVQTRVVRARPSLDDFWSRFFMPRYRREQVRSIGSGVIVSPDGYIVTNEHVTEDADSIWITLPDGRSFVAGLVGSDRETDLAVLRVESSDLPSARLGDSDSLLIGEWAIALGNPFGYLLEDTKPTVTVGVVSAVQRDIKWSPEDDRIYRKVIQTDAAINPGNSGGPLVNAEGEVIGINAFIFSSSRGSEGIGFAIPINQARVVLRDLVAFGEVRPAWVGVALQPLRSSYGDGNSVVRGVLITDVRPDSPAERAGLRPNDIIRRAGIRGVATLADWEGEATFWRPGDRVSITFQRGDAVDSTVLELEDRPLFRVAAVDLGYGLWAADITDAVASELGLQNRRGAVITRVTRNSSAEAAGFERGDVIRQVDDDAVAGVDGLLDRLQRRPRGRRLLLGVERDGQYYLASYGG